MPERPSLSLGSSDPAGGSDSPTGVPSAGVKSENGPARADESGGGDSPKAATRVVPFAPVAPPRISEPSRAARPPELNTEEPDAEGRRRWREFLFSRQASSCLVSCVFHATLLLILGLVAEAVRPGPVGTSLVVTPTGRPEDPFEELDWEIQIPSPEWAIAEGILSEEHRNLPHVAIPLEEPFGPDGAPGSGIGLEPSALIELFPAADAPVGGGLDGRGGEARARLVEQGGGTRESEAAVERGLRWLFTYQRDDGSWNFDHNKGRQSGFSRNPGTVASTTGATAIALAPFLGAGYTHLGGEYQDTVQRGLYYLKSRALVTSGGADLQEGTMYAQGLSAIVLCEGYAMTGDPGLKDIAQQALDFIDYAQDKRGGGWRYTPGSPGDTTVTGWQLMALKSGEMANLHVRSPNVFLACRFLDSVSCEDGARYGYMTTDPRKTTTAIGLLSRMYTGWRRSNPGLRVGVSYLSEWGPSEENMYYNYYATQVMRHWGGPEWEKWNPKMRDYLVA
ncbi:MAG: prenyltransferase/squalene oxidase repeat-containing protein, partial [Planctomycetota bacterium]